MIQIVTAILGIEIGNRVAMYLRNYNYDPEELIYLQNKMSEFDSKIHSKKPVTINNIRYQNIKSVCHDIRNQLYEKYLETYTPYADIYFKPKPGLLSELCILPIDQIKKIYKPFLGNNIGKSYKRIIFIKKNWQNDIREKIIKEILIN
jgi:hypothetical protein